MDQQAVAPIRTHENATVKPIKQSTKPFRICDHLLNVLEAGNLDSGAGAGNVKCFAPGLLMDPAPATFSSDVYAFTGGLFGGSSISREPRVSRSYTSFARR